MKSLICKIKLVVAALLLPSATVYADAELTAAMQKLQQLTHKLSLATHHQNRELSRYYLDESMLLLEQIQDTTPEDKGMPIAVHIDRFAKPAYFPMKILLMPTNEEFNPDDMKPAMDKIIDSCNKCHEATKVEYIKIINATNNPFNMDFEAGD